MKGKMRCKNIIIISLMFLIVIAFGGISYLYHINKSSCDNTDLYIFEIEFNTKINSGIIADTYFNQTSEFREENKLFESYFLEDINKIKRNEEKIDNIQIYFKSEFANLYLVSVSYINETNNKEKLEILGNVINKLENKWYTKEVQYLCNDFHIV